MFIQLSLLAKATFALLSPWTSEMQRGSSCLCVTHRNQTRPGSLTPNPLPFPESVACSAGAWGTSVLGVMCVQLTFARSPAILPWPLYPSPGPALPQGAFCNLPPPPKPPLGLLSAARLWSLGLGAGLPSLGR